MTGADRMTVWPVPPWFRGGARYVVVRECGVFVSWEWTRAEADRAAAVFGRDAYVIPIAGRPS